MIVDVLVQPPTTLTIETTMGQTLPNTLCTMKQIMLNFIKP